MIESGKTAAMMGRGILNPVGEMIVTPVGLIVGESVGIGVDVFVGIPVCVFLSLHVGQLCLPQSTSVSTPCMKLSVQVAMVGIGVGAAGSTS